MRKSLIILCSVFLSFLASTNINYAQDSKTEYLCIIDGSGNNVQVAQFTTTVLPSGDVHAEFITSLAVNDNSYGLKGGPNHSVNWGSKIHKFSDLLGSDKAIFEIYNANGSLVMDFDLDYIGIDPGAVSGYASHGIDETGEKSDGELRSGQASWLLDYNTSLTRNLNELGYTTYTTLSPETINNTSYTVVNPGDANWIFEMIYEVTISKNAFGPNGFVGQSSIVVPNLHNSPAKIKIENPFNCDPPVCDGLIGDFIWEDQNCNGIQDPGEPGISGVTVYLKDDGGNIIATATTDINGRYLFEVNDLCDPDPNDCEECNRDNKDRTGKVSALTLKYNGSVSNANIIVKQKNGAIVFNGTVQPGSNFSFIGTDKGTLGTEIELFVNGNSTIKIHTSCSQPLAPGMVFGDFLIVSGETINGGSICPIDGGSTEKCYTVEVDETTVPDGYYPSPLGAGPSDIDSNLNPSLVCLSSDNNEDLTIDFGFCKEEQCLNTIGDFVWHDTNTDGIQDPNESGIEGVVVALFDGGGTPLATTVTDINGYYEFDNLPNGTYKVRVPVSNFGAGKPLDSTAPNMEWNASPINKGGDDSKDSDALKGGDVIVVLDCNDDLTIDFGFFKACITVEKTGPTSAIPGDVITFVINVTNCGDAVLSGGVDVSDPFLGWNYHISVLNPGETKTFNKTYTVTDEFCQQGYIENCVEVIGHPIDAYSRGYANVTDNSCWTVNIICDDCEGVIGDFVWLDYRENGGNYNCNGIQDPNEPGIPNVTVVLKDVTGAIISSTTTDGNGFYHFNGLCDGCYTVQVLDGALVTAGYSRSPSLVGSNREIDSNPNPQPNICLDATSGRIDNSIDFGYCPPDEPEICEVGDWVWLDANINGIQDPGEIGVRNILVKMFTCNDVEIASTNTDAAGYYHFTNVTNGNYYVRFYLPTGYAFSPKDQGSNDLKDSDADPLTGKTDCFNVTPPHCGTNPIQWDAGIYPHDTQCDGKIGDRIWLDYRDGFDDYNCDGIQQRGESGIEGVTVILKDISGVEIRRTTTSADGTYMFIGLCDGCYTVEVLDARLLNAGYSRSPVEVGSDRAIDSNPNPQENICLDITSGRVDLTIDFGYCPPTEDEVCEVGDWVWLDGNINGIQDNGEVGFQGVMVKLFTCDDVVIGTTHTDADGYYLFTNVVEGDYYVRFYLPNGYVLTAKDQGLDDLKDSDADPLTGKTDCFSITPPYCDSNPHRWDAGLYPHEPPCVGDGKIGDRVWLDHREGYDDYNCDGIQQPGEPGIEGVRVILKDASGAMIAQTITDADGMYLFENLCTDDKCYLVFIDASTLPPGYVPTPSNVGSDDTKDSDGSGVEVCLTESHQIDLTIDFGFCPSDCTGCEYSCIGDYVWNDIDKDGIQDNNEPGIEGITVDLYSEAGIKVSTTVTNSAGNYLFTDLIPGKYYVRFILPDGYAFTLKNQGSDHEIDSDADANGRTALTLLYPGVCDLSWDAGLIPAPAAPSCIGDRVWFDSNYNGLQDLGESGIGGVTVKLWNNGILVATDITDNFGAYKFNNLPAGNYKVVFILPAGYLFTLQNVGSDENIDSDANPTDGKTIQFYLNEGECQLHWDAGMYADLPDLRLDKVVDNPNPEVGDYITFTITVCNDGPADATGVEVTDYVLTEGVTYVSSSPDQGSYNPSTGIWNVGSLANGECAELDIVYVVEEWNGDIEYEDFDLGIAGDYNVFALCSVNFPSSDTECKMAVGWDAYLSYYSVGDKLPPSGGSEDALVVGRSLTFTSGAVYGGNVVYGTTTNLPIPGVSISDGSLIQDPNRIDFHAAAMYLKSLSSNLAGYAVNANTDFQWGTLKLTGTDPHLNVFHVSGDDLTSAHTVTINVPNGAVVLVNIDGNNITWSGGLSVNGTAINNVLYNFYQATYITIQGIDIRGSILAPCALVDFVSGVQNGQMIAKYITGRGQYNCEMFLGHIPHRPHIINIAEITHVDQDDPDSTPGNGVPSEDDYATASIFFSETYNGSGGNNGNGGWEPVGNLSIGETVWTITADFNGNLLAGTAGGKLYISYDSGTSWTHINASMTVGFIWSIAVTNSGGILLGTEQGLYYSANLGVTWSGPLGGLYFDFRSVAIDNATNTFYAASWGLGVYKSVDFGNTWLPVNLGLGSLIVNSLVIDSQSRVYAGTFSNGVYVSTTAGASWVSTNIQFSFTWAMAITSTNYIYAATYGGGVFVSVDNGTSWQQINSGLEAEYVYAIAVNASDEVYVSTWTGGIFKFSSGLLKSQSNANTVTSGSWEPVGMTGTGISALMVDRNASAVYAGGENGAIFMKKENAVTDVQIGETLPVEFSLSQNFPNPFNPSTTIKFSIPVNGSYKLKIYNIIGEQVAQLINGEMDPGYHEVQFDAGHLSSGIYLYSLVGKNVNITRKMILMK